MRRVWVGGGWVVDVAVLMSRIEAGREDEGERVEVIVLVEVRRLDGRLMLGRGDAMDIFLGCVLDL